MKSLGVVVLKDGAQDPKPQVQEFDLGNLTDGEVIIANEYSGINYKDALALTGRGRILKTTPLVPGIDCAGTVVESKDARFKVGLPVVVTGCGIGEMTNGGFAKHLRARGDWVIPLPKSLTTKEAAMLGTAGFTAALAIKLMLRNGQGPKLGPILVTGASGGVGQFAVCMASALNFEVIACSGKVTFIDRLKALGAKSVTSMEELKLGSRPLESVMFGGAIDNVGGTSLPKILAHTQLWGNVVAIGLASGAEFQTTVMPHILRGVSLLGASSNNCAVELRHEIWRDLATHWKPKDLSGFVHKEISLEETFYASQELIDRKIGGRFLVKI